MFNQKTLMMLVAGVLVPAAAHAAGTSAAPRILQDHRIIAVMPYVVETPRGARQLHEGRAPVRALRGAAVLVQAEPQLTAEWLQLTVTRRVTELNTQRCSEGLADDLCAVRVKVTSVGTAFEVYFIARDSSTAQGVLGWARTLVD